VYKLLYLDSLLKENENKVNIDTNMGILEIEEDNARQIDNLEDNLPHLPPGVPKRGRPKGNIIIYNM